MTTDRRSRASMALSCLLVLAVDLIAFVPRLLFGNRAPGGALDMAPTRAGVPGIAYEVGLLYGVLALAAGTRLSRPTRRLAVALFAAFLVFSFYHEAYLGLVYFVPTVVDDWRLLLNLLHFVGAASRGWHLAVAAGVLGVILAVALAAWSFRRFQEEVRGAPGSWRAGGVAAFAVLGAVVLALWPANPVIQPISDGVIANIRSSRAALARWRAIAHQPVDARYDAFASVRLTRRPNVYLLMIEAYGESLATCASRDAYRELLGRIETRLAASGYLARSGYSVAPIFGARSWLSMATVQTGIHIDTQPQFRVLEHNAPRVPTLTSFFKRNGYYTMMLQPLDAPRFGVTEDDLYRRDRAVINADLPYRGPHVGLAGVPDQYSLGYFDEHFLATAPSPRFVYYMAVSTHYTYWPPGPFLRDWHRLDGPVGPDDIAPWPPLKGRAAVTDKALSDYLTTVEYEWRALADFIDARKSEDALVIVVGDHQPRMSCPGVPVTYNTPIHVLSRDPALVDLFADVGLEPGLWAAPGRPQLKHEGLFSLVVSKLASLGRAAGAPSADYYSPDGARQTGLRR